MAMLCTFAAEKNYSMKLDFYPTIPDYTEDLNQSPHESQLISIQLKVERMDFASTFSSLYLFEGAFSFRSYTPMPRFDIAHDSTWDDLGRAYYDSRDFQLPDFHCTLYFVDELKQQIEAIMRQYEQNRIMSVPYVMVEEPHSNLLDRYFAENHCNEDLIAWIENFKAQKTITETIWKAVEHYSCHPYEDSCFYQLQLAKLSLSVHNVPTSAASRPCCRSFLMASCRQLSGDDLLGH